MSGISLLEYLFSDHVKLEGFLDKVYWIGSLILLLFTAAWIIIGIKFLKKRKT